jgi:hypothetical protein
VGLLVLVVRKGSNCESVLCGLSPPVSVGGAAGPRVYPVNHLQSGEVWGAVFGCWRCDFAPSITGIPTLVTRNPVLEVIEKELVQIDEEKSTTVSSWFGVYVSMKRIPTTVATVITFVLACVFSAVASPCAVQGTATTKPNARRPSAKEGTRTGKKTSESCDETNSNQGESQAGETVVWDPISCWDCSTPGEPATFFLVGLVFAAPTFLLVMRLRTRKRESAPPKRFLQ